MLPNLDLERRIQALERNMREIRGDRGATEPATWTPTVTQSVSVAATVDFATYTRIGNRIYMTVRLTLTAAGIAGNVISIGGQPTILQPVDVTLTPLGVFTLVDQGTAFYAGAVLAVTATDWRFMSDGYGNYQGATPSWALANSDLIVFEAQYRI